MFGTIGHATMKPGTRETLDALMSEWNQEIRPKVPGRFIQLTGNKASDANAVVFVALAENEETYRQLADMPEQHGWFSRFSELVEGEISWEDVELSES